MTDPAILATSLGKPVANGMLSFGQAMASITMAISRGMRDNILPGNGTLDERIAICRDILALAINNQEARREQATGTITRTLKPMIGQALPSNQLLAEAHNANADNGFPLSEDEVREVAATEVYWSLQRKRDDPRR